MASEHSRPFAPSKGLEPAWNTDGTLTVNTPDGSGGPRHGGDDSWPGRPPDQEPHHADTDLGRRLHGDDRISDRGKRRVYCDRG